MKFLCIFFFVSLISPIRHKHCLVTKHFLVLTLCLMNLTVFDRVWQFEWLQNTWSNIFLVRTCLKPFGHSIQHQTVFHQEMFDHVRSLAKQFPFWQGFNREHHRALSPTGSKNGLRILLYMLCQDLYAFCAEPAIISLTTMTFLWRRRYYKELRVD